ncbi:MAG: M1 family metallopeptidase [Bacteroidota bacterium]
MTCTETGESTSFVATSSADSSNVDIFYYGLDLRIDPDLKSIEGHVVWGARRTSPHTTFLVELDDRLNVYGMYASRTVDPEGGGEAVSHHRLPDADQLVVRFPEWVQEEEPFYLRIDYGGVPVVAETPPWDGGFVWERSGEGIPWFGVTAQMSGASIWWPSKNHPSDRPDSVSLAWTVPDSLVVASNGTLVEKNRVESGWQQWHWRLGHPVSPYQISINAGPYRTYKSHYPTEGDRNLPIQFWLLPEQESKAQWLEEELMRQLEFYERWLGPYPFDDEKLGVVHTPYLGMEHQTILSYGSNFGNDGLFQARLGFDDLLHHELAHEWWGNLVTVRDWRHFWMHEGFATYMQALYAGELSGRSAYRRMMRRIRPLIRSRVPLVPPDPSSTSEMAMKGRSADVYYKGAWILHTLREWIGSERFDPLLKSFLWEGPGSREAGLPPSRTINSEMWIEWMERHLEEPVRPVLESYLYDAKLPYLILEKGESSIYIRWSNSAFCSIPVEIETDQGREQILIPESGLKRSFQSRSELVVDPEGSILMDDPVWK